METHFGFFEDVGNALLGKGSSGGEPSLMSPDNTSDGWLRKKWTIMDGKRCLVKGGSGAVRQEPYNEVLASRLMDRLGIPHVDYHVSIYRHYQDCCRALGISGMTGALDRMIVVDFLIANEDRHQNNFGVVRHAETLEWLGAAPICDSGSSLWFPGRFRSFRQRRR